MKTSLSLLAACLVLAPCGAATAQSLGSLNDARAAVRNGTTPGITIIPARKSAEPAAVPASAAASASAKTAATPAVGAASAAAPAAAPAKPSVAERASGILRSLPPPSGTPITSAKRLDSPQLGIPLPTGASGPR
jgi:hypothetical protein